MVLLAIVDPEPRSLGRPSIGSGIDAGLFREACLVFAFLLNIASAVAKYFYAAVQRELEARASEGLFSNQRCTQATTIIDPGPDACVASRLDPIWRASSCQRKSTHERSRVAKAGTVIQRFTHSHPLARP